MFLADHSYPQKECLLRFDLLNLKLIKLVLISVQPDLCLEKFYFYIFFKIPSSGFINVHDFSGPKELSEYLLYLDQNSTAYNSCILLLKFKTKVSKKKIKKKYLFKI